MSTITKVERRERSRELKPTQWQALAQAAYCGGDFAHLKREQFNDAGDTLFSFIMSELDEDCPDFSCAMGRLEAARDQIDGVITALLRKG